MATALSTLTEPLKRELAVPGTFATLFPDTTDADLLGSLADAFGMARLYRFFPDVGITEQAADPDADPDPIVHDWLTTEDLSLAGGALLVIYASMGFIRAQLRNLATTERYKAGSVEFETGHAATVLTAELEFLQKRLDGLLVNAEGAPNAGSLAKVYDSYIERGGYCGGFHAYEYH